MKERTKNLAIVFLLLSLTGVIFLRACQGKKDLPDINLITAQNKALQKNIKVYENREKVLSIRLDSLQRAKLNQIEVVKYFPTPTKIMYLKQRYGEIDSNALGRIYTDLRICEISLKSCEISSKILTTQLEFKDTIIRDLKTIIVNDSFIYIVCADQVVNLKKENKLRKNGNWLLSGATVVCIAIAGYLYIHK